MDTGLLRWQPFTIWGGPYVSLGGVPCVPLPPMTLLLQDLITRIQKRIFLGHSYAMGFDWQPCTLLSLTGGILALRHLHPLAAPLRSIVLASSWGGLYSPPLLLLIIMGVFILLLSFSLSLWGVFLFLLSCLNYEGHGGIILWATYLGGLCFFRHSSICHSC